METWTGDCLEDKLNQFKAVSGKTKTKTRVISMQKDSRPVRKDRLATKRSKFNRIIGKSQPMQEIYQRITEAGSSESSVVLYGESGTGKELIARTIHDLSTRSEKAFTPVNCGAIPESIFENEFFGHRRGAFTGADSDKPGFFDQTDGGTIFLDEVGE
ncbi:MAG: sigma 54-interacting transcriptional regulator, partial [Deltaproteobacteria bacterium]|nr:sigma 54-interacting transcriptional regulator [Deltaproteobacteria bacterium]